MKDPIKRKVGYAFITGDLLHWGHVRFLTKCKSLCDYLVVGVDSDKIATENKRRPIIPFHGRVEVVEALACVDEIRKAVSWDPAVGMKELVAEGYNLKYLFHGDDWTKEEWEKGTGIEYIKSIGGEFIVMPYIKDISTSKIIQTIIKRYCK